MATDDVEVETVLGTACSSCGNLLEMPWIRCSECKLVHICLQCFSMGVEFDQHENDHAYSVVKLDFPIYEASWTACEELRLLDAIQECGLGNWVAVGGRMRTKTGVECERHYMNCYVERPEPPLPEFKDTDFIHKGAPILFKLSDNPPRPAEGTSLFREMGGYSAARCDFDVEYNNFVEMDVCQMDFSVDEMEGESQEDKELYYNLNLAVLEIYGSCLKERQRRKKIVRDHGLINIRRWYGIYKRRYNRHLPLDFLRPFMKLFPSSTFDKYLESLFVEKQLKTDIVRLQDYRKHGLTHLRSLRVFQVLKHQRQAMQLQHHLLDDVLHHVKDESSFQSWLARQAVMDGSSCAPISLPTAAPRKSVAPLDIQGLPGYEKLSDAERQLCSEVRLVPQAFLDFSKILVNEFSKAGQLKLAQARALIKIDVNKTRKLYDFLLTQGVIHKEPLL